MPRVTTSQVVPAPIEAVWDLIRDFNGHDAWHPIVATSAVEGGGRSDRVGCVRNFRLADGVLLRERLLSLSDAETMFRYCLIDTPIPLYNYVAEMRCVPVTLDDTC
ncbi:MAG: SRPBCC family protein, partial [Shimia sp.]